MKTFAAPVVAPQTQDVTRGPDNSLWFTEPGMGAVGALAPSGKVTRFALPPGHDASGAIANGPDGNVWFAETNALGRLTPTGTYTGVPLAPDAQVTGITAGPDGNLWYLDTSRYTIGKVTPAGAVTEYAIPPATSQRTFSTVKLLHDITAGPDGNVWYTAEVYNHHTKRELGVIGRVTPEGDVSVFRLRPAPRGAHRSRLFGTSGPRANGGMLADAITAGPDGNVWFTEHQAHGVSAVARITPEGKITQFAIPRTPANARMAPVATDITTGDDGNLWFNLATDDFLGGPSPLPYVGRVTPSGEVTVIPLPAASATEVTPVADGAESLSTGPGGGVWFAGVSRTYASRTGRVIGSIAVT